MIALDREVKKIYCAVHEDESGESFETLKGFVADFHDHKLGIIPKLNEDLQPILFVVDIVSGMGIIDIPMSVEEVLRGGSEEEFIPVIMENLELLDKDLPKEAFEIIKITHHLLEEAPQPVPTKL